MSLQIGELVDGKYRILERLGTGGMGEVYKVEHVYLRATRVVKVIRPQISESTDAHDRFLREAQLATKVQHPNVATLHDFSALPDGSHYMVWEYIEGENLAQVIRRRGVLPPGEAIRLTVQTLAGLDAIHRAGIIHRDISPENLMVTRDNNVKIIDLGVAKAEMGGDYAATQTGMFVGKLRYSSPEQLGFLPAGEKIDSRADLYSLGVVLFEMLTGRPPFEATSPHQYFIQHSGGTNVQPIDLTQLPNPLRPVLSKALESDRNRRFANAREFSAALDSVALRLPTQEEDTMRVTPLPATVRTPMPATVRTPMPAAAPKRSNQTAVIVAVVLVLLIGLAGVGGVGAWWYFRTRHPVAPGPTEATTEARRSPPATTTVEVTPPQPQPQLQTAEAPPPATPAPVSAAPAPQPKPQPAEAEQAAPPAKTAETKPATPKQSTRAEESVPSDNETVPSYVEGGMSSRNDEAISATRDRLRGVTRVTLEGRGDDDLIKEVNDSLRGLNLTVADGAEVTVRFYGTVKHLRFGRKERAAEATILKRGHPIFHYTMKPEEYRVGDNPAEAFARVLSDVFGR